jgi:hypothetical protein
MTVNGNIIIISIVVIIVIGLVWYQINQQKHGVALPGLRKEDKIQKHHYHDTDTDCPHCSASRQYVADLEARVQNLQSYGAGDQMSDRFTGPSDPIKSQDLKEMQDPLSFPQLRLPREVLEKYQEYYEQTGSYPPFGVATRPLFETPLVNGFLIRLTDPDEAFVPDAPSTIYLYRQKSAKNNNRFFYYVIDNRQHNQTGVKIPLEDTKINGVIQKNSAQYGLPEIYHGDIIERIPGFEGVKFKVHLYRTNHFP